ncbi:hypothetical protein GMMP15_620004 [Candidatus Magnetomoraceae bacterium gMMP-15]
MYHFFYFNLLIIQLFEKSVGVATMPRLIGAKNSVDKSHIISYYLLLWRR